MLTVHTELRKSDIHGLGVFALEPIAKGCAVWHPCMLIDSMISEARLSGLPDCVKLTVAHHGYRTREHPTAWFMCGDNARFMNHSDSPNTGSLDGVNDIALRDIQAGEELTSDYATFNLDWRTAAHSTFKA